MKTRLFTTVVFSLLSLYLSRPALALDGSPFIHDPATIMECDGKYYTFGTGGSGLVSDDGWTWQSGNRLPQSGAAPDVIHIGDKYIVAIGATGGGLGGGHNGTILTLWNKTLDPQSPDFKFSQTVRVASSDGIEDCDAIDPGLCLGPDGRLWCTYGTFFGFIRIVELDPKTGERIEGNKELNIAIDCEATTMIYRDGWYYLFGDHGTCCNGVTSTYNIRVGRSRKPTGPFVDNIGQDMLRGGGKLVVAANNRLVGPGHFGLIDLGDDVQKFSCHYEADMDRGGRSVLDVRTLLWKNGWPVAGEDFKGGTFEIESERSGYALELAVDGVPLGGGGRGGMGTGMGRGGNRGGTRRGGAGARGARGGGFGGGMFGGRGGGNTNQIPDQDVNEVSKNWPDGKIDLRLGDYMLQAHQKWSITPVADAGGYLGSPYFKITVAGTERTLAMTENADLVALPEFTGGPEQLWRIDQLIDGTYRIMPKVVSKYKLALTAVGASTPSVMEFDPNSDKGRWNLKKP